jgi:tetratricopeptide (TPR) repeat protein
MRHLVVLFVHYVATLARLSRDFIPYNNLGLIYGVLGNSEKALEECRESLRLAPTNVTNYLNVANAYTSLNRLDEAEAVYKQAEERKLESEILLSNRYQLAFLKGDTPQMARLATAAMGKPGAETCCWPFMRIRKVGTAN